MANSFSKVTDLKLKGKRILMHGKLQVVHEGDDNLLRPYCPPCFMSQKPRQA